MGELLARGIAVVGVSANGVDQTVPNLDSFVQHIFLCPQAWKLEGGGHPHQKVH
jgi:hypothetical protein